MLRGFRNLALLESLLELVKAQQQLIATQQVSYSRTYRDLLQNFLIALDNPEEHEGVKELLHDALCDLSDEVARLEEHCPV